MFALQAASRNLEGFSNPIVTGVMAFVMSIVTMIRVSRNMPRNGNALPCPPYFDGNAHPNNVRAAPAIEHLGPPALSPEDYMMALRRMSELEEKLNSLSLKPAISSEKEEMLNAALNRVDALEHELSSSKKVSSFNLA